MDCDDVTLLLGMHTASMAIWDVHLEQRSPREIAALVPPSLAAELADPLITPSR